MSAAPNLEKRWNTPEEALEAFRRAVLKVHAEDAARAAAAAQTQNNKTESANPSQPPDETSPKV